MQGLSFGVVRVDSENSLTSLTDPYNFIFRPGRTSSSATGRGILSMQGLSYGVVRVDSENSLTSLTDPHYSYFQAWSNK